MDVLDPAGSWLDKKEYDQKYRDLAARFIANFKKFETQSTKDILDAGPHI